MRKLVIFILAIMLVSLPLLSADASEKKAKKNKEVKIEYETKDHFLISAKLSYPKKKEKLYPLIVLLHSIALDSKEWGILPDKFLEAGFAVLSVDLRGHGESIYNINLDKKYWQNMSLSGFAKYPSDVCGLLDYIKQEHKNVSVANMAIVGADVGANTAILASQKMKIKPYAIVLISPQTSFKGLYIPIALADLQSTNILFVYSENDFQTVREIKSIKRFAQAEIAEKTFKSGGSGMVLVKNNPKSTYDIVNWCIDNFNAYVESFLNPQQTDNKTKK